MCTTHLYFVQLYCNTIYNWSRYFSISIPIYVIIQIWVKVTKEKLLALMSDSPTKTRQSYYIYLTNLTKCIYYLSNILLCKHKINLFILLSFSIIFLLYVYTIEYKTPYINTITVIKYSVFIIFQIICNLLILFQKYIYNNVFQFADNCTYD